MVCLTKKIIFENGMRYLCVKFDVKTWVILLTTNPVQRLSIPFSKMIFLVRHTVCRIPLDPIKSVYTNTIFKNRMIVNLQHQDQHHLNQTCLMNHRLVRDRLGSLCRFAPLHIVEWSTRERVSFRQIQAKWIDPVHSFWTNWHERFWAIHGPLGSCQANVASSVRSCSQRMVS